MISVFDFWKNLTSERMIFIEITYMAYIIRNFSGLFQDFLKFKRS